MLKKILAWIAGIAIAIAIIYNRIASVLRRDGGFGRVYDAIGDHDERTREREGLDIRSEELDAERDRAGVEASGIISRADEVIDRAGRTIESNREFLERYRKEREGKH